MVLEKLADLGFSNVDNLGTDKNRTIVRVRTSKGWVYERFADDAEVKRWAEYHQPEVTNG